MQGKSSNPLKVLIKENKVIYQMYKSAKFGLVSYCHYISLMYIYIYIYIIMFLWKKNTNKKILKLVKMIF